MPISNLEAAMRTKEECKLLSDAELTLEEFSKYHPDEPCGVHYRAVVAAIRYGYPVFSDYATVYPSLAQAKPSRRKRDK
jgi:hypothetical protein